jgi:methylenetetrahydrofolate dehydrogenase (NADP+)/methenyltetrahydrofolate cyclohydrolase
MSHSHTKIIDGKQIAAAMLDQLKAYVVRVKQKGIRPPCLAVVLVGNDTASQIYVRNKKNACVKVGISSQEYHLAATTSQDELLQLIAELNQRAEVDGILVQLPLPAQIDSKQIIDAIAPNKDVDGFHRYNMGSLAVKAANLCPCTPHGVMYLLDHLGVSYHGSHAVILGASNIVGRPMALELINRGATVTICNSKTRNLETLIGLADILVAAIGKPNFVAGHWLKPGAIVIDVGINRLADGSLCGDIDFNSAYPIASAITPVPGGVGPMTIAMLLSNTIHCYKLNNYKDKQL